MNLNCSRLLSFLLMLCAALFAYHRAQNPEYIGIDFVQFHLTGQHVVRGGDPHVYSDKVRHEILEGAWQVATSEGTDSKLFHAVHFRHERTWETYSSPFLYAVFGATGGRSRNEAARSRTSMKDPSSGLSATFSPDAGEKGRSGDYERAINRYWIVCLGSTMIGFITFGWVLRIPAWSMLLGAVCLVWFSPLRIDMNVANVNQIQFGMVGVLAAILGGTVDRSLRRPESLAADGIDNTVSRRRSEGCTVRQFVAGIWLGLCLAFKPSLLWCGIMWLGPMAWVAIQSRERRERMLKQLVAVVVGGVLGGTLAVAFSAIWFPLHCWIEWIQAVRSLPDDIIQTEQGNYSLTYYMRSSGAPGWLMAWAGPVLGLGLVLVVRQRLLRRGRGTSLETRPTEIADLMAIGCLIHLLTSNLVWYHYGIFSLPAMIVVLRHVVISTSWREAMLLGGILLWCLLLIGLQPVDEILASPPNEHFLRCTIANVMLLILVVMLSGGGNCCVLQRGSDGRQSQSMTITKKGP